MTHPTIKELGKDLLEVPLLSVILSVTSPFILWFLFIVAYIVESYFLGFLAVAVLSFITYASVSHDLLHCNLALPKRINELLFTIIEIGCLRSPTSYRITHIYHHKNFPSNSDLEGRGAKLSLINSLASGPFNQIKLWIFSYRTARSKRKKLILEALVISLFISTAIIIFPYTFWPLYYVFLIIGGSWFYPLMTAFVPHNYNGDSVYTQTRLFRGKVNDFIFFSHLYHLEHHLYPQVPHHNWKKLSKRLDPFFSKMKIKRNYFPDVAILFFEKNS